MIIALDTGIHVRATPRSSGPARRLLQRIADDSSHVLAISPFILAEIGKVLCYPRMQSLLGVTPEEIHEHLAYLRSICRIVEPEVGFPVVLNDPDDDPIVYTAVAAGADVLCAVDRHFHAPNVVAFCQRYRIQIMTDLELLSRLTG